MTRALLVLLNFVFAFFDQNYIDACNKDEAMCRKTNYKNDFDIPSEYNKHHSPCDIVELEVGTFYQQLLYVDTARGAFGLNFHLNVRWTDPRLTWSSSRLEVTSGG